MHIMIEKRQASLLCGLVEEYIRTGEPVGSTHLKRVLGLDDSPATIRNLLRELEEAGYILQPHTSAGRIPTDKGYRYYVDFGEGQPFDERALRKLAANIRRTPLPQLLAELSHSLAAAGHLPDGNVEQAGLSELVEHADEETLPMMREASDFIDHLREYFEHIAALNRQATSVFIGEENPFIETKHTSMLIRTIETGRGEKMVVVLMGPKRMPYARNISLLEAITRNFSW